ncbi:hypothetical protein ACFE04_004530 [Oxalis oulophora]
MAAATLYVLINCDDVKPYIDRYKELVHLCRPDLTDQEVEQSFEDNFAEWLWMIKTTPTPITPPPPKSTPPPARTVVISPPTSSIDVSPPHTMDTSTPSSSAHISTPPMSADSTDSFNKNFNAWSNDTNDDDDSASDEEPPNEYEVWLETIGNCNKRGRMPGFGGEAKFIRQGCGPSFSRRMEENEQSVIIANLRKDIEEIKKANVQPHPNPHYYPASHGYYGGPGYYYPPSGFPAPPNPNASVQPTLPGYHSEASHSAPPGFHLPFVHQTSQPSLPPHSFTNLLANNQPFSEPRTFTNLLANKQPAPISLSGENDDEGRGERLGGEWFESE